MRQLFFAIVLVGAAFGGGAMVNGPALQWARERVSLYMGLNNGEEIASIDLPPSAGDREAEALLKKPESKADAPADLKRKPSPRPAAEKKPETKSPEPVAPGQPLAPASPPLAGPSGAPGAAPSVPPPAPLDPGIAPALLASLSPAPSPSDDQPPPNTPVLTATPPPIESPSPSSPSDGATAGAAASGNGDWAELRRKLKAAGVSRYSIEAETEGRVVFTCLIPLAGKQAVAQQFEGEGDDEFTAARAALRRINLWRATQTAPPSSP